MLIINLWLDQNHVAKSLPSIWQGPDLPIHPSCLGLSFCQCRCNLFLCFVVNAAVGTPRVENQWNVIEACKIFFPVLQQRSLNYPFWGESNIQIYGIFTGVPLWQCTVWVGLIMIPVRFVCFSPTGTKMDSDCKFCWYIAARHAHAKDSKLL